MCFHDVPYNLSILMCRTIIFLCITNFSEIHLKRGTKPLIKKDDLTATKYEDSRGSGSFPDNSLDSGLGMLSSSGQMTRSNQLCNAASIEAPEFVKMQFSAGE